MRLSEEPDTPAQINIVPMIDVIFAILTFFILATLFLNRSEGLPVNLPQAKTAKPQLTTRVVITMQPDGEIFLNRVRIDLSQLESKIRDLVDSNQKVVAVINADEQVEHGKVVSVMDRIRQIEGAKLAIATQSPQSK